jgi:hypothetical protein
MRADKHSYTDMLQNHFRELQNFPCQIHVVTEVLLDLGTSLKSKTLENT